MKATSWSSITRSDPITPPTMDCCCCWWRRRCWGFMSAAVAVVVVLSGSVRGATARDTPDIFYMYQFSFFFL